MFFWLRIKHFLLSCLLCFRVTFCGSEKRETQLTNLFMGFAMRSSACAIAIEQYCSRDKASTCPLSCRSSYISLQNLRRPHCSQECLRILKIRWHFSMTPSFVRSHRQPERVMYGMAQRRKKSIGLANKQSDLILRARACQLLLTATP